MKGMIYKKKICAHCGKEYQPTGGPQKNCAECRPLVHAALWIVYRKTYPERIKGYNKTYLATNRKKANAATIEYQRTHPEKVKAGRRRSKAKRRVMGFTPLNNPFPGCEGHHIDENDVVYIPKTLHRSVGHDHWTGRGMEQINFLVRQWLLQEGI